MDFGTAFAQLRAGRAIARRPWLDKGLSLTLLPGLNLDAAGRQVRVLPFVAMMIGEDTLVPWTPSSLDICSTDWTEVVAEVDPFS